MIGPSPMRVLLGHTRSAVLEAVAALALLALAFSLYFSTKYFSMFSRSISIALRDSGTVLWVKLYWFLHATGR